MSIARNILILAATVLMAAACVAAGDIAERRVREASALQCARLSDGADMSIADCYADRDLPIPDDI